MGNSDGDKSRWDEAKKEALAALRQKAREQDTISYSQFVRRIKAIRLRYHDDTRLDRLLDEISIDEDNAGRGLITGTSRQRVFESEREVVYRAAADALTE